MQEQIFQGHGQPRVYAGKRGKTDNTDLLRRYHSDPAVRSRIQAQARNSHFKRTYGITNDDYDHMLERQSGVCAVCGDPPFRLTPKSQPRLHVDHCHATGNVRGLLCSRCNHALGHAKDDPERLRNLAVYVESFKNTGCK